jgi:hypothetical protein
MATTTTNFGWDIPQSTDLVKDGATAIAALGQDIDTAFIDLKGGTTGQVLAKASGTDLDFSWVAQDDSNAIQNAIVDAKGDLIAASAADTPARLAIGANGTVLTADSAEATGMKWATTGAAGKVLQVVQATTSTAVTNTTTTFADTGLSGTITPSATTSKVLVMTMQVYSSNISGSGANAGIKIMRGATDILVLGSGGVAIGGTAGGASSFNSRGIATMNYLDSPATTSATTYKTQGRCQLSGSGQTVEFQVGGTVTSTILLLEIGA